MRRAEIFVAIILALCSIAMMVKSAELPIRWIDGEGPGAGAFPFWLSAGMLVCCFWIAFNWWRGNSDIATSTEPYMTRGTVVLFATGAGSLGAMIGLIHFVGVYFSVPLFLVFYLRFVGNHKWWLTLVIALLTPVLTFFFFEVTLRITLPKGHEKIEEIVFLPLYDLFF